MAMRSTHGARPFDYTRSAFLSKVPRGSAAARSEYSRIIAEPEGSIDPRSFPRPDGFKGCLR